MTPNAFQKKIIDSKQRVTVITAEPGSGTSTGLIMALAEEAIKAGPGSLVLYSRPHLHNADVLASVLMKALPPARYSSQSQIISFEGPDGECKIKLVTHDYIEDSARCTGTAAIAMDMSITTFSASSAVLSGRKVFLADRICSIPDSWGCYTRIVLGTEVDGYVFTPQVEHITGRVKDNPGLSHEYMCALIDIPDAEKKMLFKINF